MRQGSWELDGKKRTQFDEGRQALGTGHHVQENNKL
jgi:hypothetical protein